MPTVALSAFAAGQMLGKLTLAVLFVLLVLRAFDVLPRRKPVRNGRATDLAVAALLGVLLAGSLLTGRADAWDGTQARELRAGFLAGCETSAGGAIDCECVFAELTSAPPYDTPAGFATLQAPVARAVQTGDNGEIPAAYISAVQRCVGA
jgi:hypothetical protein